MSFLERIAQRALGAAPAAPALPKQIGPAPLRRQAVEEEEPEAQRQVMRQAEDEEPEVQRQAEEEEETLQRKDAPEEPEETVQRQAAEEEEEETVQRQAAEEEEETVQRQADEAAEEEEVQRQAAPNQGSPDEEPEETVQRDPLPGLDGLMRRETSARPETSRAGLGAEVQRDAMPATAIQAPRSAAVSPGSMQGASVEPAGTNPPAIAAPVVAPPAIALPPANDVEGPALGTDQTTIGPPVAVGEPASPALPAPDRDLDPLSDLFADHGLSPEPPSRPSEAAAPREVVIEQIDVVVAEPAPPRREARSASGDRRARFERRYLRTL